MPGGRKSARGQPSHYKPVYIKIRSDAFDVIQPSRLCGSFAPSHYLKVQNSGSAMTLTLVSTPLPGCRRQHPGPVRPAGRSSRADARHQLAHGEFMMVAPRLTSWRSSSSRICRPAPSTISTWPRCRSRFLVTAAVGWACEAIAVSSTSACRPVETLPPGISLLIQSVRLIFGGAHLLHAAVVAAGRLGSGARPVFP